MTILFFDTETTGLPDFKAPHDAPHQPYIVQLAGILCDDSGKVISKLSMILDNGVDVPAGASNVHGITTKCAEAFGCPPTVALAPFFHLWVLADLVVAHNIKFDVFLLKTAVARLWGTRRELPEKESFCTMEVSAPLCGLPPTERMIAAGIKGPKSPKLEEAYLRCFGEPMSGGAHDALVDAEACMRIYFFLKRHDRAEAA